VRPAEGQRHSGIREYASHNDPDKRLEIISKRLEFAASMASSLTNESGLDLKEFRQYESRPATGHASEISRAWLVDPAKRHERQPLVFGVRTTNAHHLRIGVVPLSKTTATA
jgi:hypothetical protein